MRILVFVILAVFYAVGSIVKAKANKTALKEEQISRKPAGKPPESSRDLQRPTPRSQPRPQVAKPQVQPPHRKVARPQPLASKLPTKAEEAVKISTFEPLEASKVAAMEPQVQPKLEELPELTPAASLLRSKTTGAGIPQTKYLSEILSDYDDPERLRRAILHYEILGKPLSLRDSQGYT